MSEKVEKKSRKMMKTMHRMKLKLLTAALTSEVRWDLDLIIGTWNRYYSILLLLLLWLLLILVGVRLALCLLISD